MFGNRKTVIRVAISFAVFLIILFLIVVFARPYFRTDSIKYQISEAESAFALGRAHSRSGMPSSSCLKAADRSSVFCLEGFGFERTRGRKDKQLPEWETSASPYIKKALGLGAGMALADIGLTPNTMSKLVKKADFAYAPFVIDGWGFYATKNMGLDRALRACRSFESRSLRDVCGFGAGRKTFFSHFPPSHIEKESWITRFGYGFAAGFAGRVTGDQNFQDRDIVSGQRWAIKVGAVADAQFHNIPVSEELRELYDCLVTSHSHPLHCYQKLNK